MLSWALGICGLSPLVQLIIIFYFFIFLFFESVSLYIAVISETVCLFCNIYFHSHSFMKKELFEKLSHGENILCINI